MKKIITTSFETHRLIELYEQYELSKNKFLKATRGYNDVVIGILVGTLEPDYFFKKRCSDLVEGEALEMKKAKKAFLDYADSLTKFQIEHTS